MIFNLNIYAKFGIKSGVNFADVYGEDKYIFHQQASTRLGFSGGMFLTIPLKKILDLQLEALFTRKGAKYKADNYEIYWNLDYVDIPLILVMKLNFLKHFGLNIFGGISWSGNTYSKIQVNFSEEINKDKLTYIATNNWETIFGGNLRAIFFFRISLLLRSFKYRYFTQRNRGTIQLET